MWHPGRGRLRAARSLAVGLVVALLAATSHLGGGGHTSWLAVLPAVLVASVVTGALSGRRLSRLELVTLLAAAQLGVHVLSAYLHEAPMWHAPTMLGSHLVGVVVTALVLAHGEALLWRLHAWLRPRLLGARPSLPTTSRARVTDATTHVARPAFLLGGLSRRGPPVTALS